MPQQTQSWSDLLVKALAHPGCLGRGLKAFHEYSLGNQMLAVIQCEERGLTIGPLRTLFGWQKLGRKVMKGEKALTLCQPLTRKTIGPDGNEQTVVYGFTLRKGWFLLSQTAGEDDDFELRDIGKFSGVLAMENLNIRRVPFTAFDGNVHGYATGRDIAVNEANPSKLKTYFHELAHVLLGHTATGEAFYDRAQIDETEVEAEAEGTAMLCCDALGLDSAKLARGFLQRYLTSHLITEKSAQRMFTCADKIIKAGFADMP